MNNEEWMHATTSFGGTTIESCYIRDATPYRLVKKYDKWFLYVATGNPPVAGPFETLEVAKVAYLMLRRP